MTTAPISVERLRYLAQEMLLVWNEDWIDELAEALPALLQQLAELESDRDEWKRRESFAVSDLQRELRERDAKLAERDAEVAGLRQALTDQIESTEAAERAREEACGLLRECPRHFQKWDDDIDEQDLSDHIAAYLAANGGDRA